MNNNTMRADTALSTSMMSFFGQQEELRRRAMPDLGERVTDGLQSASDAVAEAVSPALRVASEFTSGGARVFHAGVAKVANTARAGAVVATFAATEAFRNFMAHMTAAFSAVRRAVSTVVLRSEAGITRGRRALADLITPADPAHAASTAQQARIIREEGLRTAAEEAVRSAPRFSSTREKIAAFAPMASARAWTSGLQERASAFTFGLYSSTANVLGKAMDSTRRLGPSFAAGCVGAAIPALVLASGILSPAHMHAVAALAAEGSHHLTTAVSTGGGNIMNAIASEGHAVGGALTKGATFVADAARNTQAQIGHAISHVNLRVGEQTAMNAYHNFMQSASAEYGKVYNSLHSVALAATAPDVVQNAEHHVVRHVHSHAHHLSQVHGTVSHGLHVLSADDAHLAKEIAYARDHSADLLNGMELDTLKAGGHLQGVGDVAQVHAAHIAETGHHAVASAHEAISSVSSSVAGHDGHAQVVTAPVTPDHKVDFGDRLMNVTGLDGLEKEGERLYRALS